MLDIKEVAEQINLPIENGERECCDIYMKILRSNIITGKLLDGKYIGEIHANSVFLGSGSLQDGLRHCWIELDDGRVVDPIIWTITCEEPYIYVGENNDNYVDGQNLGFSFYEG